MNTDNFGLWAARRQREQEMLEAHTQFADAFIGIVALLITAVCLLAGWI
jgi:hypothetical protein